MAVCNPIVNPGSPQLVKWSNGAPVTNVAHINSTGDTDVIVVTDDGKAYGGNANSVSMTPIVDSGAIAATGGKNPQCVLVQNGNKKDVLCGNANLSRPALPTDFDAMQITASYGFVCALNRNGEAWCWIEGNQANAGGGIEKIVSATPSKFPFSEPVVYIQAGQNSVCGIKFSGGTECKFSYDDTNVLPSLAPSPERLGTTPPNFAIDAKAIQIGYKIGVVISEDGSAKYYPGGANLNVGKAVAAGGDRAAISLVNENGDVYLFDGGTARQVNGQYKAEAHSCSLK